MAKVHFSGEFYRSVKFIAPGAGDYEVDEDRATYLTSTFPNEWTRIAEKQPADQQDKKKADDKSARAEKKTETPEADASKE